MRSLRDELSETEARAETLRRRIAAEGCAVSGHDWKSLGGKNAGCAEWCGCSVPVHECTVCGDCDYGENAEAERVRAACQSGERGFHV